MTGELVESTPVLGRETPLARIPAALRQLWTDNQALTKASLMNFVVYSENEADLEANTALIQAVTRHHACRALLLSAVPSDAPPQARAWVTAHCQNVTGSKAVCSEQIAIELRGQLRDTLRNVIFAHLESDLPFVLYWQGDLTDRWERYLFRHVDRLVVDSASWRDPRGTLQRLREAWRDAASHFVVLDITWSRLFPFRQALSGAFDLEPARQRLNEWHTVTITHAPGHRLSAALLASWVAYKAGWSLDESERIFIEAEGPSVSRLSFGGSPGASLHIEQEAGASFLRTTWQTNGHTTTQLTPAAPPDPAGLVSERLSRGSNTPLYFKLWKQAEAWL